MTDKTEQSSRPLSEPQSQTPGAGFAPLDPGRIQVDDPVELRWWADQLGCDVPTLERAVADVGHHVTAVREHLATARR